GSCVRRPARQAACLGAASCTGASQGFSSLERERSELLGAERSELLGRATASSPLTPLNAVVLLGAWVWSNLDSMPGNKRELIAHGANLNEHRYCACCRRWWPEASLVEHQRGKAQAGFHVDIQMPSTPRPKKEDIVIIHPAHQRFIEF